MLCLGQLGGGLFNQRAFLLCCCMRLFGATSSCLDSAWTWFGFGSESSGPLQGGLCLSTKAYGHAGSGKCHKSIGTRNSCTDPRGLHREADTRDIWRGSNSAVEGPDSWTRGAGESGPKSWVEGPETSGLGNAAKRVGG